MLFYQNIDCDSTIMPYLRKLMEKEQILEEDLYPFIDEFIDTNVTDIVLNVFAQISFSPSQVIDDVVDVCQRRVEDGYEVDYTEVLGMFRDVYRRFGDPFAVWFRRIRACGMRAHLSVRMNDCHCPDDRTSWLRSSFFYTARDRGYMDCVQEGYYRRVFNYRYPEVRRLMLDYIREQLLRYDVDGLELDFMREILCFDYAGKDRDSCVSLMNDFMREVKGIAREAEEKHGHAIELIVRLSRDIEQSRLFGFDAVAWEREGLVDTIVPSPRFQGSDTHIPVSAWKRALPKTRILPCLEGLISSDWGMSRNGFARMPAAAVRGNAMRFLADGADGHYTFNMFGQRFCDDPLVYLRDKEVQYTLGESEDMAKLPLRFITVNEDTPNPPKDVPTFSPIPLAPSEEETVLTFITGTLPNEKRLALILGFEKGSPEQLKVAVNGIEKNEFSPIPTPIPQSAMAKGTVCYYTPIEEKAEKYTVSFQKRGGDDVSLSWIEIDAR